MIWEKKNKSYLCYKTYKISYNTILCHQFEAFASLLLAQAYTCALSYACIDLSFN